MLGIEHAPRMRTACAYPLYQAELIWAMPYMYDFNDEAVNLLMYWFLRTQKIAKFWSFSRQTFEFWIVLFVLPLPVRVVIAFGG